MPLTKAASLRPRGRFTGDTTGFRLSSVFWVTLLSGMAALLVVVGILQYLWTSEVSIASEARMGSDLESVMIRWHLDLYREFSAICVALQVGPDSGARDAWEDYLQRFTEWSHDEPGSNSVENIYKNPDFVADLFIWETSRKSGSQLLRLNRNSAAIGVSAIPPNLSNLLNRLQTRSSSLPVALRAWQFEGFGSGVGTGPRKQPGSNSDTTGWQFDPTVPAIVHPIIHRGREHASRTEFATSKAPVDWIVLVLNSSTIERKILPTLAKRYFGRDSALEYDLAVVAGEPAKRVLYTSDARFSNRKKVEVDSVMEIFGPPPETVEAHSWQSERNSHAVGNTNWHRFPSPVWFPVIQYSRQQDPWLLLVRKRNGPLSAVVTRVRKRNLGIGSIVLLLLAANMTLVVLMSQRTHKLGRLQMTFVTSVTHDLRTPLAGILSACENITAGFVRDQGTLKKHASIIIGQTRQLISLVDQILLFASTSTGKHRYVFRRFAAMEVIDQVLGRLAPQIQEGGFTVDVNVAPGLPELWGDLTAICQCVQNLVGNALKYSGKSRWVGVTADFHEAEKGGQECQIRIQDRGVGINPSEISEIFNPFYRAQTAVDGQIPGTGLGLAVARSIAEAAGGRISVTSSVGAGSVFTLHLPVSSSKEMNQRPSQLRVRAQVR